MAKATTCIVADASLEDDQPSFVEGANECHVTGVPERCLTASVEEEELEALTAYAMRRNALLAKRTVTETFAESAGSRRDPQNSPQALRGRW